MADTILYFGSFNPPHNGHTEVARYVAGQDFCERLWFVVSPRNPLKSPGSLAPDRDRLEMTRIAVNEMLTGTNVRVSDVEFSLPRPSFTIDTLRELEKRFPQRKFALLGGSDILNGIFLWKQADELLDRYRLYIYPRQEDSRAEQTALLGDRLRKYEHSVVVLKNAPRWRFSSTDVRHALLKGEDIGDMVSPGVKKYITSHRLWTDK